MKKFLENVQFQYLLGIIGIIFLSIVSISLGSVSIPFEQVLQYFYHNESVSTIHRTILSTIRIPKTISAISAGISLSIAGFLLQTLFKNPLASPSSMGISSGASLGVAFVMLSSATGISSISALHFLDVSSVVLASIIGAIVTTLIILLISIRVTSMTTLLLVGFMIGTLNTAIVGVWQYVTSPDQLQAFFLWSMGSLHTSTYLQSLLLLFISLVISLLTLLFAKQITVLSLGEDFAKSLGVNVNSIRFLMLLFSSILTGAVTAFCGPIGFVGIIIPHIVRFLVKSNDTKKILPYILILGSGFLLCCDILTSLLSHSFPLPISLVTSIIGAPLVLWILMTNSFYTKVS